MVQNAMQWVSAKNVKNKYKNTRMHGLYSSDA